MCFTFLELLLRVIVKTKAAAQIPFHLKFNYEYFDHSELIKWQFWIFGWLRCPGSISFMHILLLEEKERHINNIVLLIGISLHATHCCAGWLSRVRCQRLNCIPTYACLFCVYFIYFNISIIFELLCLPTLAHVGIGNESGKTGRCFPNLSASSRQIFVYCFHNNDSFPQG